MRIAVTGATGFVGTRFLRRAEALGHEAVALVRGPSSLPSERVIGDLGGSPIDPGILRDIDAVVHLAARTHVMHESAVDVLAAYRRINVVGTQALLDAAVLADVPRFLFMSSIKAVRERSAPCHPIVPATEPHPEDAYGISKLEAEAEVRRLCDDAGVAWTILRPPLVYGPGAKGNIARLAALIRKGIPLPFAAVRNRRSMVHVDNLADAALRACTLPAAARSSLLVADLTVSTPELISKMAEVLAKPSRLFPVPTTLLNLAGTMLGRGTEMRRLTESLELDVSATEALLDWEAPVRPQDAFADMVRGAG